jgi:hypothetical protein
MEGSMEKRANKRLFVSKNIGIAFPLLETHQSGFPSFFQAFYSCMLGIFRLYCACKVAKATRAVFVEKYVDQVRHPWAGNDLAFCLC